MLNPYRVLDLTTERGLLCGQILADLGADVIKVEPPGGSSARKLGPFYQDQEDAENSLYWWAYNRNKRGVTLDITRSEGQDLLRRLARDAKFLIESDNPDTLAQYGLSYNELAADNPGLIYVSITPFGQDGPKASYADSDLVILASSGPLVITGDEDRPPVRLSVPQGYLHASAAAAPAALIALYESHRSNRGQHIDISAQQAAAQATQSTILAAPLNDAETRRMAGGAKMGPLEIRLLWPAKDGHVSIAYLFGSAFAHFTKRLMDWIYEEGFCDKEVQQMDWVDMGGGLFGGDPKTLEDYERLKLIVEDFTKTKTKEELFQNALDRGLLVAPVTTIDEVVESEQLESRQYWTAVDHEEMGKAFAYPGPFAKFSEQPIDYKRRPPKIGEHNAEVYGELGLDAQALAELQNKRII
ncbi:MAG: CaiB/BaiF CoA-transferase family protein [Desulfurellaceae bacterium]|nr:CaiB/BaiF CoA-transferase family protein [Desulfurellaceae bacterium]